MKPGDDLALLAVNKILFMDPEDTSAKIACAAILEEAILHSPNNPYLKFAAIDIYHQLDATSLSWELYKSLELKHIQLDSCSFIILPYLVSGGLYNEVVELCNSMIRFHTITARDCGDYAGRAMKSGVLSKADEFMVFQRTKMNKSLSMLEAKGLILDAAAVLAQPIERQRIEHNPILHGRLGQVQGIVGAESDSDRANQMISEIYNPFAALSIISWAETAEYEEEIHEIVDNRDFSISSHQVLYSMHRDNSQLILREALRRGHIHGLLLRAALLVEGIKAPKKGKVVSVNDELKRRTESFLKSVEAVHLISRSEAKAFTGGKDLLLALTDLCHVLSIIGTGEPDLEIDSLEEREVKSSTTLEAALVNLQRARKTLEKSPVKGICFSLPNYIVPLFSLFQMCSRVCELYGWGKRKSKTKRCAGKMASFAMQFSMLVEELRSTMTRYVFAELEPFTSYFYSPFTDKEKDYHCRILAMEGHYSHNTKVY